MIHSEKYYKEIIENYRKQVAKLKKENQTKDNEVKILKIQNKQKDEVIHDLDRYNYRGQYLSLKEENEDLKKNSRSSKKNSSLQESA